MAGPTPLQARREAMIAVILFAALTFADHDKARTFCPGDVVEVWERRSSRLPGQWRRRVVVAGPFGLGTKDEQWDMVFPIENLAHQHWRFVLDEEQK
jgi:hypothetical protein